MKKLFFITFFLLIFSVNFASAGREYGRKPYLAEDYRELMDEDTNVAIWEEIKEQHSEFEKPYEWGLGEYAKMQHYHPDIEIEVEEPYDPWHMLFLCTGIPCYTKGKTECFNVGCSYPIIYVEPTRSGGCGGIVCTSANGQVCVHAHDDPDPNCEIDIVMRARVPCTDDIKCLWHGKYYFVYGRHSGISLDECDDGCVSDSAMAWDFGTSAETITQNDSVIVAITGNNKPFAWSVSGAGFTLGNATTTGLTNTLYADGTACGSAAITVTGCDGTVATGYVRGTTGQWISCGSHTFTRCGGSGNCLTVCSTYFGSGGWMRGMFKFEHYSLFSGCNYGNDGEVICFGTPLTPSYFKDGGAAAPYLANATPSYDPIGYYYYWACP